MNYYYYIGYGHSKEYTWRFKKMKRGIANKADLHFYNIEQTFQLKFNLSASINILLKDTSI